MSLNKRKQQFEAASKDDSLVTSSTKFHKSFGTSNRFRVINRGLQLCVVNLVNVADDVDGFAFASTMVFPPGDEVYFTAYVRAGAGAVIERLNEMKRLGEAAPANAGGGEIPYSARNNLVVVVLAYDGCIRLRNKNFWDELPDDLTPFGTPIPVDKINVALYPPAASVRRSSLGEAVCRVSGWPDRPRKSA